MLVAMLVGVGAAACSDDTPGTAGTIDAGADTVGDQDTNTGQPDTGGLDTSPDEDAGDAGADDAGRDAEQADAGDAGNGADEPDGVDDVEELDATDGGAEDATDGGDEDAADADSWPDVTPDACAFPSQDPNCPQGALGPGSFINYLHIVEDTDPNPCCFDYDGDGRPDNYLGGIVRMARSFGLADINANISQAINLGLLVYLIEFEQWTHPSYTQSLMMTMYNGVDTDGDFASNLGGWGDFYLTPESFDDQGDPKWRFAHAQVYADELLATGGSLELYFPGLLDEVVIRLVQVRLKATVEQPADLHAGGRVFLSGGEMSGALERDTFFGSLNDATNACGCIGRDLFRQETDGRYTCRATTTDRNTCNADPNASDGCKTLADPSPLGLCSFLANQSTQVDVDTDGDGENDAYSFGARFTSVGAGLTGMAP